MALKMEKTVISNPKITEKKKIVRDGNIPIHERAKLENILSIPEKAKLENILQIPKSFFPQQQNQENFIGSRRSPPCYIRKTIIRPKEVSINVVPGVTFHYDYLSCASCGNSLRDNMLQCVVKQDKILCSQCETIFFRKCQKCGCGGRRVGTNTLGCKRKRIFKRATIGKSSGIQGIS